MSTDYGIYCFDCSDAYIPDNGKPDDMQELISNAGKLAVLRADFNFATIEVTVGYSVRLDLGWFEKHGQHRLDVVDEYGARYPRCDKRFSRVGIAHELYCYRKTEHEEACSDERFAKGY